MDEIQERIALLIEQHDAHVVETYSRMMAGAGEVEMATMMSYGLGLWHAIRTLQS